jgi:2-oxoglutarate ferredoxin oxidoreductase subunit delta
MAKVRIDKKRCKGCQLCIAVCPKKNLKAGTQMNARGVYAVIAVDENDCTGCGMCYLMCPDACIEITDE